MWNGVVGDGRETAVHMVVPHEKQPFAGSCLGISFTLVLQDREYYFFPVGNSSRW